jgi:putative Mn2+ efflux pump MntP
MNAETQLDRTYEKTVPSTNRPKNIFASKTVWGVIFTTVAAIAPIIGKDVDQFRSNQSVNYGQDIAQVIVIICGAAATICGRVDAKDPVYTPDWLPGPNKSDLDSKK